MAVRGPHGREQGQVPRCTRPQPPGEPVHAHLLGKMQLADHTSIGVMVFAPTVNRRIWLCTSEA